MKIEAIPSCKGELSLCHLEGSERIARLPDFLDLIGNCPTTTIVVQKAALTDDFFDLRSGIAGEFLQKISTYNRRLVILGEPRKKASKALKDFIDESNRTGKVVFAPNLETAIALLR